MPHVTVPYARLHRERTPRGTHSFMVDREGNMLSVDGHAVGFGNLFIIDPETGQMPKDENGHDLRCFMVDAENGVAEVVKRDPVTGNMMTNIIGDELWIVPIQRKLEIRITFDAK